MQWQYHERIPKMIKFDSTKKENKKQHNSNWPQIPDHPCVNKYMLHGYKNLNS